MQSCLPRRCSAEVCGIATFTRDLRNAVVQRRPGWYCPVVVVTDPGQSDDYPEKVRFEIPERG